MLDIELVTPPTATGLDIVSVADLASHLRLSPTLRANATWIANMTAAINEAVDGLHGRRGTLNRTILPCTWKRYLSSFPATGCPILLPFPDLISVTAITIEDGSSPANNLSPSAYVVTGALVPEIYAVDAWPTIAATAKRAVSVTYQAGFSTYPPALKRLVKILAAHALENPEATINEPRQMKVNRKVDFGVDALTEQFRIPVDYSDWGE